MAVSKSQKIDILENLKKSIKEAKSVSFTTNNWLTVDEITNLRKSLREVNTSFTLAKKTLIKIAFKEVYNIELEDSMLNGQIAVVCSNDDAIAWLGKVNDFIKSFKKDPKVVWAWSYIEWELKNAEDTSNIASIPSKDVLLWRLVWSMLSPISALARFFDAASKKLNDEWIETLWSKPAPKKEEKKEETEEKKEEKVEEVKETKKKETEEKKETPEKETKIEEVKEVEKEKVEEKKEEAKEAKTEEKAETKNDDKKVEEKTDENKETKKEETEEKTEEVKEEKAK